MTLPSFSGEKRRLFISGNRESDAENMTIYICEWETLLTRVVFCTDAALGANLGVDLIDGGVAGAGTDVIQASSDNLNGSEAFTLEYLMDLGDRIDLTFDNYAAAIGITWTVEGIIRVGRA